MIYLVDNIINLTIIDNNNNFYNYISYNIIQNI